MAVSGEKVCIIGAMYSTSTHNLLSELLPEAVLPEERGLRHALLAAFGSVGFSINRIEASAASAARVGNTSSANSVENLSIEKLQAENLPRENTLAVNAAPENLAERARVLMDLPRVDRVCVVLIDGLGYHQLTQRLGHVPTIRSVAGADGIECVTTVAPSTTAAALTSFATAAPPGQTSMLSYSLHDRRSRSTFDLISFRNSAVCAQNWQTHPTLFERLTQEEAEQCVLIVDPKHEGSGLTMAAWRGVISRYARRLEDRVDVAVRELKTGKKLAYLYWGNLDHKGHVYGANSQHWLSELEYVDACFAQLLHSLPRETLVILVADHGMVEDRDKVDIAHVPHLNRGVEAIAGEERGFHVYCAEEETESLAERWREYFSQRAWVLTRQQLAASHLFGEMTPHAYEAMGNVMCFARESLGVVDSRALSAHALKLRGVHGSFTAEEMHVPWIVEVV